MAIVLPVLVMILFAIIEFGIAFQRWQIVTNAAREGARAAVVRTGTCDAAYLESVVDQYVT
ncbi:MAG: pilus assembly protein, partial [Myxococcales bacterium]|nr:pilus assembly protein [Myxococcales bacterium]